MHWLFKSNHSDPDPDPDPDRTVIHLSSPDRGGGSAAKDDISRIFRGVSSFLAPPPSSSQTLTGIRNDLVEIGGSFKSSLSLLSTNRAVTGISKLASQLLQLEPDHQHLDDADAVAVAVPVPVPGITDEVVRFVKQISTRPQCWTEFPVPLHNDFSMSNSQREHALAMERLVPEFLALRLNLCSYMNVEKFWMIYFLLILPRLNQHDFEHLSTPEIVEAREVLLRGLGERKVLAADYEKPRTGDTCQEGGEDSGRESISFEQNHIITDITKTMKGLEVDDMITTEKWLEDTDTGAASLTSCTKLQQEDDVSFSDLEDDGGYLSDRLSSLKEALDIRSSSPDGSSEWVQLHESSDKGYRQKATHLKGKDSEDESNDWLTVDEFN